MKICEICGVQYNLKLLQIYVHFAIVIKNLHWLQKTLSRIIYVVVIKQIEEIVHGARNHAIMIRP